MLKLVLAALFAGIVVVLLPDLSRAQPTGTASFPLGDENRWSYYEVIDSPRSAPDTISIGSLAVERLFQQNGHVYYRWRRDTIRTGDRGRIWRYNDDGPDVVWFDFTKADGTTYTFRDPDMNGKSTSFRYTVTVSRNDTTEVNAGRFPNAATFTFALPGVMGTDYSYTFVAGVGPIHITEAPGPQEMHLDTAWVDGTRIPSRQRASQASVPLRVDPNFPDPFQTKTTIPYRLSRTGRVRIAVYDVLGRHVTTVMNRTQSAGRHSVVFAPTNLPGGVYFYRIVFENQIRRGRMVVVK